MSQARYVIADNNPLHGDTLYWNFSAWRANRPDCLLTGPQADAELARLKQRCPGAHIVDWIVLEERHAVWIKAFRAVLPHDVRSTPESRARARAAADAAVRTAGYRT